MATLAYTADIQARAAYLLFGRAYASLQSYEQVALDGQVAVPTAAPTGAAGAAITRINQYAQWFAQAGATAAPDVWGEWLAAQTAYLACPGARNDDKYRTLKPMVDQAIEAAMGSFELDGLTAATLLGNTMTLQGLRWHVLSSCIRRKPRLFIPAADVDAMTMWCLNWLWNRSWWNFRRRQCVITIPTTSVPTFDLTAEAFHAIASVRWFFDDVAGVDQELTHLNAREMAAARVRFQSTTGRPRFFRVEPRANAVPVWWFAPAPDRTYTAKGEVFIDGPPVPANATDTAPFLAFPLAFRFILRDAVLARVLLKHGQSDGEAVWAGVQDQVAVLLTNADSTGNQEAVQEPRDVYNDAIEMTGDGNQIGGMM